MSVPTIDWVVLWKLFHLHFFLIYAVIGVPLRLLIGVRKEARSANRARLYAFISSFSMSLLCTWLPIIPIIMGALLMLTTGDRIGHAASGSFFIGVPLVAVSMGIETALVEWLFSRWLLDQSVRTRFVRLLIIGVLNSSIALTVGLAWVSHRMPIFIASC
ncbi:MAG TPA: hypothetical protein VMT67_02690 [Terriglobales bacterium]|nr:hypothetical protein [Terriglobales bacterium]